MDPPAVESFSEPLAPVQGREHLQQDFRTALRWLGRRDRALLWLHIGMGVPLVEVAQRLGYCPAGIRKLKLRAKSRLEKALSSRGRNPHVPTTTPMSLSVRGSLARSHPGIGAPGPNSRKEVRMNAKQALVLAIESEMARQGISQRNLARRLDCTQENIAQMLDDRRPGTRLDTAERLAKALGQRLFLALIPETSLETTFTFPLEVAERVDSETPEHPHR
jgi:hypothetical protein